MSEVRPVTPEEVAEFGFPDFGENQVDTQWNESGDVSINRYRSNQVKVINIFDYRSTPNDFLRQLANDAVKIMGTRVSLDLLAGGATELLIPVEEDLLRPGRTGGRTTLSVPKLLVLLAKEREGSLTEEEAELLDANHEKIEELRSVM